LVYKIDIMTLFPDSMSRVLGESILGRAAKRSLIEINCIQIRDFTGNKQNQVDDYPYGGGWGCVMMAQPLKACLDHILSKSQGRRTRVIYMSPQGQVFNQETAKRLVRDYDHLVLVCGHYEGIDERFIEECVDEEISIGDFVLTGGEIPAMAVCDAVCRLVPGVLSDEECFTGESHWDGLLEYPQYTRPEVWEGRAVPEVLLSGNHAKINRWRRKQSLIRTMERRPDLFARIKFTDKEDLELLAEIRRERAAPEQPRPVFDYRRGEPGDIDGIMEIVSQARDYLKSQGVDQWQNGYPDASVFLSDMEKGNCWVFTCDDEIVGVIAISMGPESCYETMTEGKWLSEGAPYGVIHRSAVRSDFRGSGLASEMFALAEDLCLGMGAASMRVDTHRDNMTMRCFLEKCGYALCGVVYLDSGPEKGKERLAYEKVLK
jgi:tRNA (guanine37-N1)-methyltransferase